MKKTNVKLIQKSLILCILCSILIFSITGFAQGSTANQATNIITASKQILDSPLFGNLIQVGNKVIKLPAKYSDFIAAGAKITTKGLSDNFLMDVGSVKIVEMLVGKTNFRLYMKNISQKRCALKDAQVQYIYSTKGVQIFYPKGIKIGDTLSTLTKKWGEPSVDSSNRYDDELTYNYLEYPVSTKRVHNSVNLGSSPEFISATGNQYTVRISRNSSKITDIQYKWVDSSLKDQLIEKTQKMQFGTDKYTLSYKIPKKIDQNSFTLGGKGMSVYMIDKVPYIIIINPYMDGFGGVKEITDKILVESINNALNSKKYNIEILKKTESEAAAVGYLYSDKAVECRTLYIKGSHKYSTYESKIIPLEADGIVTAAATKKFKEIMSSFTSSILCN